jgi:hypothetical protein
VDAPLAQEPGDLEDPGEVKAEEDDDHPADPGDPDLVVAEELAQEAGRRAQRHEDEGESRDEEQGVDDGGPTVHPLLQVLQAHAGDEREVGRHQGKHAGGQERQHPGGEGDQNSH